MLGHCATIIDVERDRIPVPGGGPVQVYGASRCRDFAWLIVPEGDNPKDKNTIASINREVVLNADNYAWYATAELFTTNWGKDSARKEKQQNEFNEEGLTIGPESGNDVNDGVT